MHKYIFRGLLFLISIILISLFNLSYSENINQNLIENPSVEDSKGILPENWFKLKIGNNKSFFSNRLIGQDAKKSVSVNVTSYKNGLNGLVFKPVDIESNTKYKYSEYYISGETTYIYLFYFTDNNKTKVKKINLGKADSSKEWKKIEYEFVTPNDAKKLTILHFIKSKGILVTDNFSLTKYSEDAKEELENDSKNDEDYISKDCNNLTMTQKSGSLYNTLFTCDGTNNVKQYKIEVLNSLGKVINTINTKTGSYTFVNDGNYSARCLVNGESTVSPMCQKTFTIKSQATASLGGGGGGGSGGGGTTTSTTAICSDLIVSTGTGANSLSTGYSCLGNSSVTSYKIDIFNGSGAIIHSINNNIGTYIFGSAGNYSAKCYVNGQITTANTCQKSIILKELVVEPKCNELTATKYLGDNPLESTFNCNGNSSVNDYKINIFNGYGSIIHTINSQTGSFIFNDEGSYTAKCFVNNQTDTPELCEKSLVISPKPPIPVCTDLISTPNIGLAPYTSNFSCEGNITTTNYKIEILNSAGDIIYTTNNQTGSYLFNTSGDYTAKCYVNGQTSTTSVCINNINVTKPTPPPPPPSSGPNLITNPSLETISQIDPNLPQSWHSTKIGENDAVFNYLNTGNTGNRSAEIKITSYTGGLAFYYFDSQAVDAGSNYDLSLYYKSDVTVQTDMEVTTVSGKVYKYVGTLSPAINWTKYSTSVTIPSDAISITFYTVLNSVGTLVTDDYVLAKQPSAELNKAIITLTFDDYFSQSFYDTAYQSFKKYSMAGTMYLVGAYLDQYFPGQMSQSNLKEMIDYGFEIGSHTLNHPYLTSLTETEIDQELLGSKNIIEQFIGSTIEGFASPYGAYNDTTLSHIKNFYQSHRTTDEGLNNKYNFDKYLIKAINPTSETTPEMILAWVDQAIEKKAWLVIVYHDINYSGGTYTNTPEHIEAVLSGLNNRKQAGLIDVKTNKEALIDVLGQIGN